MTPDKISFFEEFLKKKPADDFAQYALAMEYRKVGRHDDALTTFDALLARNPDYAAAWFQSALMLQGLARIDETKDRLRKGIEAATRSKDAHARREMEGVLADIEAEEG